MIAGTTCEFCARYGGPAPEPSQPWQAPQWPPPYQPAMPYGSMPAAPSYPVDTGINLLELGWARTRVRWASVVIGLIGLLSMGAYWVITKHPDIVGSLALGFLIDPDKVSRDSQTTIDVIHIIVYFVLSWLPFAFFTAHALNSLLNPSPNTMTTLTRAADLAPLLWQGIVYLGLAVLIWRRSIVALVGAALLFLADGGIYTFAIFKLFSFLWDQSQKFNDFIQANPSLSADNPYDISHWPWELVVPIVIRVALFWFLLSTFSAIGVVRLHHARLKEARRDAMNQAAA